MIQQLEVATGEKHKRIYQLLYRGHPSLGAVPPACLCSAEAIRALLDLVKSTQLSRREQGLRCLLRLMAKDAPAEGLTLLSEAAKEVHCAIGGSIRGLPAHHPLCKLAERLVSRRSRPPAACRASGRTPSSRLSLWPRDS